MILYYDFGEYEIDTQQVAEAIADTFKRGCTARRLNTSARDNSLELFITDLINDEVLDEAYIADYYLEDIMSYWENQALEDCEYAENITKENESMLSDYVLRGSL